MHSGSRRGALLVACGNESGLWEAINALPGINGKFSIACDGTQVVLGNYLVWDVG